MEGNIFLGLRDRSSIQISFVDKLRVAVVSISSSAAAPSDRRQQHLAPEIGAGPRVVLFFLSFNLPCLYRDSYSGDP